MNILRNKIFGYRKFQESADVAPRLTFKTKFKKSAYPKGILHPALEQLLYYIYKEGQIDPLCVFGAEDSVLVQILLKNLKKGNWRALEEIVSSPGVAVEAIHQYLNALPKSLWHKVKAEEWTTLRNSLQDHPNMEAWDGSTTPEPAIVTQKIFKNMKPYIRHFSIRLLKVLYKVTTKCDDDIRTSAAFRLSEYFVPVLVKNVKRTDLSLFSLQTCVAQLIEKAPYMFGRPSPSAPMY